MRKISDTQKVALVLVGLFLCLVLLESGLRIGGFIFLSIQEYKNKISLKQKGAYRILCLGESTTFNQYPVELREILNEKAPEIKFTVIDKGIPGTNSNAILSQLEDNLNKYKPDMVITMIGIGDGRRNSIVYDGNLSRKTTLSFDSFRIYKLVNLLWLHIINKAREIGVYKSLQDDKNIIAKNDLIKSINDYKNLEKRYKEAIEINPLNIAAYVELARYYETQGRLDKAEEVLKKAINKSLSVKLADKVYYELGWFYARLARFDEAVETFKKLFEINREGIEAYFFLGYSLVMVGKYDEAEGVLKKALEIAPRDVRVYQSLELLYKKQGRYKDVEEMNKKIEEMFIEMIKTNSGTSMKYMLLAWYYINHGKPNKAEEMLKKAVEIDPGDVRIYGALTVCYNEQGKYQLAEEYKRKADGLRLKYYNPVTRYNYEKLRRTLTRRGIRLVCVQYPVWSIEPLKRMFEAGEGIIFVDNERVFKEALKQAPYNEYFRDNFAGDFGHCTRKGNRLLAENIANTILGECFNK